MYYFIYNFGWTNLLCKYIQSMWVELSWVSRLVRPWMIFFIFFNLSLSLFLLFLTLLNAHTNEAVDIRLFMLVIDTQCYCRINWGEVVVVQVVLNSCSCVTCVAIVGYVVVSLLFSLDFFRLKTFVFVENCFWNRLATLCFYLAGKHTYFFTWNRYLQNYSM